MIASFYAAILALLYIFLTFYVVQGRYKYKVGLGDGGVPALTQRIRMHGNFAEFAPIALILLFMVDYTKFSPLTVHILGIMLLLGRCAHAFGIHTSPVASAGRMAGMILTLLMILISALLLLWRFFAVSASGF